MDVVVVGSCMTDLVCYAPRLPKAGETLHGTRFSVGFGGKGANQCVVSARLGCQAAMVAKLGTDDFGSKYLSNFADNQVNMEHVTQVENVSSGVAQITVDESGQNCIIIVGGANQHLSEQDVDAADALLRKAKVVVTQLEIRPDVVLYTLKKARQYGAVTIFNPAPAIASLDPEMYQFCDIICPNETEAEIMTGIHIESSEDAQRAVKELLRRGCKAVIITLGEKGAVLATDSEAIKFIETPKVTAIDTTGAGDAFVGALAFFLSQRSDLSLEEQVRRACSIASYSVQSPGTQTSYPWKKDIDPKLFE